MTKDGVRHVDMSTSNHTHTHTHRTKKIKFKKNYFDVSRNLDYLFELSLRGNNMEHIPNGTFHDIQNLSILKLENNRFRVMPVDNICLLKRLDQLYLASNKLTTVKFNQCFAQMERLHYVDLSNNPIVNINSHDFHGLRNSPVAQLYLNRLGIKHLTNGTFKYLTHVKLLSMQGNKLASLPSDVFKDMLNIRSLILSGNKLNIIPKVAVTQQSHLKSIDLTHNRIRNNNLCSEFHNLTNLHNLVLSENRLYSLSNSSFSCLAGSKKFSLLVLISASLRVLEADTFLPLRFLTMLTLHNNPLNVSTLEQAFYGLRFSVHLTEIGLDGTELTGISASTFRYLVNTSLETLRGQGCRITVIPPGTFKFLSKLQFLWISGNKVHTIEKNAFQNLNNLIALDLSRSSLTSIPNGNYVSLNKLKHLNLQRNVIRDTITQSSLSGYNQLESLLLSGNSIRGISPNAFLYIPSLQQLNLIDNKISYMDVDVFAGLTNLTHLDLTGNNINDFDVNIFQHTPNLQTLVLSRNNILTVKIKNDIAELFKPLRNLTQLMMSSTGLHHLPDSTFHNLTELTILALSNNQLSKWTPGLFRDQTKLKILSMGRNKISSLDRRVIMELTSLEQLDVSNNSFLCDCELQWFTNWIQSGVFVYFGNLEKTTCGSPTQKRGKRLMDLNMDRECMSLMLYYIYWSMLLCYAFAVTVLTLVYRLRFYLK